MAPRSVEFYDAYWNELGTRRSLCDIIHRITRIPRDALYGRNLRDYPVVDRMSWASLRQTSRVEDEAYCLMGIFDVNMPLIYGEGKKAFQRLQNEILAQEEDLSFLLWIAPFGSRTDAASCYSVQASSALYFQLTGLISSPVPGTRSCQSISDRMYAAIKQRQPPQLTSRGLRVHMFAQKSRLDLTGASLLLWTEYFTHDSCVCIALNELDIGLPHKAYGRAHVQEVFNIDASELLQFELMELYLATSSATPFTYSKKKGASTPRNQDLKVLISSTSTTRASAVTSFPPCKCLRQDGMPGYTDGPHLVDQVYYPCIMPRYDVGHTGKTVAILFRAVKEADQSAEILFLVFVRVSRSFTGCWFERLSDSDNPLAPDIDQLEMESKPENVTDRYSSELFQTGEVASISVKSLNRPGTFPQESEVHKSAAWTLHVRIDERYDLHAPLDSELSLLSGVQRKVFSHAKCEVTCPDKE